MTKIKQSGLASPRVLSCSEISEIAKSEPNLIEITTGRVGGRPVICVLKTRDAPCQFVVGDIPSDADPTSTLAAIFSYKPSGGGLLNETVERLFIRPSAVIR